MIKTVIIDDEQHGIDRLSYLINNYCSDEINIAGTATTVESGLDLLKDTRPQLVFLDVEIGELTGFDLLQRLGTIRFQVVFTTAFQQYAIQAFKFSAVDYMLKPIGPDELLQTVGRVREKMEKNEQTDKLDMLFQNMKQLNLQDPRITVPTVSGLEILKVNDMLRCQSDGNYTTIFLKDKTTLVVAKTLREFEGMLAPYGFFRIHNSHLVNLAFIKSYHKGKGGYVKLEDKTELEVSSRRKDEFLLKLTSLK